MAKNNNSSRMVLPNISSTPNLSYSQRYQHMTKLANYNEMNQTQIWKQYEKLRVCLKEINEEVLYHMQKKTYANLGKEKLNKPINKDSEGVLMLLEDEKKTNQLRYSNFYNQLSKLEERITFLIGKNNYLEQMTLKIQEFEMSIKKTKTDIKDYKRKAKVVGKNIVNCTSSLDKLILQQSRLNRAYVRHRRFKQYLDSISTKESMYKQRIAETQDAFDARIKQFSTQQNFIQEEIHFQRYEQLRKQQQHLTKYQSVYKKNYLMKLKELENIMNSINKHDKVIQQNQGNIMGLRSEIQSVSSLMGKANVKKRSTSSMLQMSLNTGRMRSKQNKSRQQNDMPVKQSLVSHKNGKQEKQINSGKKRIESSMNDKNENLQQGR